MLILANDFLDQNVLTFKVSADTDKASDSGDTPFGVASRRGHHTVLEVLASKLSDGAEVGSDQPAKRARLADNSEFGGIASCP